MPRFARLKYPGGIFHVIARCLNHEFLIEDDLDREKYLSLLGKTLGRTDAAVLAYCLMSNHVHVVVRAGEDPLAKLFKPVHTGYALWKNGRSGRIGPVFAGRFKSPLVDEGAYLLELVRYVHNNPVRAGIVPGASASSWSSHRAYIGAEKAPAWLRVGEVLGMVATETEAARRAFVDFVNDGVGETRRGDFAGDAIDGASRAVATDIGDAWRLSHPIVGDEVFAAKVLADLKKADEEGRARFSDSRVQRPQMEELIVCTCEALGLERWEFDQLAGRKRPHTARLIVTWLWVRGFGGSQANVARTLSTVSPRPAP
jgi:REP element-mobilizing transposase RayT